MRFTILLLLILLPASGVFAQAKKSRKPAAGTKPAAAASIATTAQPAYNPLQILGIRPGISMDSIKKIADRAGVALRPVQQDTLTHCFADQSIHIYIIDSIICRLTYMRMSFLIDGSTNRLRRFTITPRESSIAADQNDDVEDVLLLYFGQTYGKPELNLEPPLPNFRWRTGNIEVRGFIKRGYPIWVMEG